ncbi:MAG TPA: hypothetical protein PKD46_16810 [Aggregatilineaceae bacterium]|nr:hypothetical protein [Aggregatilineaceae bacterium]
MARRKPYEGGAWSVGSCQPYRAPATLTAIEAAQRAREVRDHWLPIAQERAAEGRRWYPGIVAFYVAELAQLDAVIAAQTAPAKRQRRKRAA